MTDNAYREIDRETEAAHRGETPFIRRRSAIALGGITDSFHHIKTSDSRKCRRAMAIQNANYRSNNKWESEPRWPV
jgi:hypothetical protein